MQNCLDGNFIYKIIILRYIIRKVLKILQIFSPESESDMKKVVTNKYCNFIISQAEIQEHTKLDNTLNLVVEALKSSKWESDEVESYKQIRNEFTKHNSILIRENRIVLPLDICKVKSLSREKVYSPGLDADVKEFISRCIPCQANSRIPPPEPVKMSTLPEKVFEEISIDFYGPLPNEEKLLSLIDLYSRFPFIEIMKVTTAVKVIERLENVFSIYGYPEKLRHDNGPPFSSHEFKQYLRDVYITDKAITPEHPQSNAVVKTLTDL